MEIHKIFHVSDWGQDQSLITINFEEAGYQDNYENIEERDENVETEDVEQHDDSDSGIDSLYECIKFRQTDDNCKQGKIQSCRNQL